jgi:branched-chain amino acid aminotransferase
VIGKVNLGSGEDDLHRGGELTSATDVRKAVMSIMQFDRIEHPSPVAPEHRAALLSDPGFGQVFTDHMVTVRYTEERSWHDARVKPRAPIPLDPAAAVLHYAQEIFEGLKVYRTGDGGATLFRPNANARRFRASAERLAMPPLPEDIFLQSLRELVRADAEWIPEQDGASLYLRPFMFADEAFLGVRPSHSYRYVVIASPVGSYFKGRAKPISVWVADNYARAASCGTGAAKCGGNYGASLLPYRTAAAEGCDQALFLDAAEHRWVEELGGMNIFFVFEDGSITTPPLTGTILSGITRDSLLILGREMGFDIQERAYAIEQLVTDASSGRLCEVFACGTAAVVSAIGRVRGRGIDFAIGDGGIGPVSERLREELVGIQRGLIPDQFSWLTRI